MQQLLVFGNEGRALLLILSIQSPGEETAEGIGEIVEGANTCNTCNSNSTFGNDLWIWVIIIALIVILFIG